MRSAFAVRDIGFLDISMLRERARLLDKLSRSALTDDPSALDKLLNEQTVNTGQAFGNLVTCFSIFLGLGLFEPEWVRAAYLNFMLGDDQLNADSHWVEESLVRNWVSELKPTLLAELFPVAGGCL